MAIAKLHVVLLLAMPFLVSYGFAVDVKTSRPTYLIDGVRYTEEGVLKLAKNWAKEKKTLNILVVGETGAGKSTLVNFLFGMHRAKEEAVGHDVLSHTKGVEERSEKINGIMVTIYDTPGFNEIRKTEESLLKKIKDTVAKNDIDLLLYCSDMSQKRIKQSDIEALQAVTAVLGASVWEKALIVLTFANDVKESTKESFNRRLLRWKTQFYEAITKDCKVLPSIVQKIPVVPAGFMSPSLPDRENWLSELWVQVFRRLKFRTMLVFLVLSEDRLRQPIDGMALRSLHTEKPLVLSYMSNPDPVENERRASMSSACSIVGSVVGLFINPGVLLASAGIGAGIFGTGGTIFGFTVGTFLNPLVGGLIGASFGGVMGALMGAYTTPESNLFENAILQSLAIAFHEEYGDNH